MTVGVNGLSTPVPLGDASAWQVTSDDGGREDLYTLWDSVFHNSHVDPALHARSSTATDGVATRGPPFAFHASGAPSASGSPIGNPARLMAVNLAVAGAAISASAYVAPYSDDQSSAAVGKTPAVVEKLAEAGTTVNRAPDLPESGIGSSTPATSNTAPDGAPDSLDLYEAPAESVHVHLDGYSVEITVRNAALSGQDALHSAFETARELAGQRSALARLMLNGRSIYQQADAAGSSQMLGSEFVFTC